MYRTIEDLPFVCRINLPEDALKVYRTAFNRAWRSTKEHRVAQSQAWSEVKARFERDQSGRWVKR